MKKLSKILALSIVGIFLLAGTAMAYSITYTDDYANWPGHFIDSRDVIGTPSVGDLTIYVNDVTGYLDKIEINVTDRQTWDTLFINNDYDTSNYEAWDYYVRSGLLYVVDEDNYSYLNATNSGGLTGRWGHPSGIVDDDYLNPDTNGLLTSVKYVGTVLTYDFYSDAFLGIPIGPENEASFVIGYSQWCANDVFLTPIPEPMTILLLVFGLLGLGLARRKS